MHQNDQALERANSENKAQARKVPKGGKTLHKVPEQFMKDYLDGRPADSLVTYATYIPRGKVYPARKPSAPATG